MSGRFLKARFKCSLAHSEHNMRAACFDMMNKISLLTMCCGEQTDLVTLQMFILSSPSIFMFASSSNPIMLTRAKKTAYSKLWRWKAYIVLVRQYLQEGDILRHQLLIEFMKGASSSFTWTTWKDMVMMLMLILSGRICKNSVPILITITFQFGEHLCTINFHDPALPHSTQKSIAVNCR